MTRLSISVAMCTFNGARFLGAQLDSIAVQNRLPDELVICDDGSTDGCDHIVREFARRATFPVRVVVNDKNLGSTKNFEKAIFLCQNAIVALADQDDIWYPYKLEQMEQAFLLSSAPLAVFSDADVIDEDSRPLDLRLWATFSFNLTQQNQFANGHALKVLVKHPVVTGATLAFRKEVFDLMSPIPAEHVHDEWISFLLAARGKIETISEPLMQYRQHAEQQMGPGPLSLREQAARARLAGADSYRKQIDRFRQLSERLQNRKEDFPYAGYAREEIKNKISHLERRALLPRTRVARIPSVIRETFNGDYWRYSSGWKSVAKDLVIG